MVSLRKADTALTPARFRALLGALGWPEDTAFVVAYSGGRDSAVLLDLCHQVLPAAKLRVLHVDHGLQAQAPTWAQFCCDECARRQIPCEVVRPEVRDIPALGPEAAARQARYSALAASLHPGEVLLMAHHREDQAETFLLRLMRGAGPLGLGSMPLRRRLGMGWLARPLLQESRAELAAYAERAGLQWVEDPSNADTRFARNWLRHRVLPELRGHWPQADRLVARAAAHQAEIAALLSEYAALDLSEVLDPRTSSLSCAGLARLSQARLGNVLRHWCASSHQPMPAAHQLRRLVRDVLARQVRARYAWPGLDLRWYRGRLYQVPACRPPMTAPATWHWPDACTVPDLGVRLRARMVVGQGIASARIGPLAVRTRVGGERFQYAGHERTLKKMLQEHRVPPWERQRLPLLYAGSDLVAVADLWVATPFQARASETGLEVVIEPLSGAASGDAQSPPPVVPQAFEG